MDLLIWNGTTWEVPIAGVSSADALAKIKLVDGSGSGLDADLLDGEHAAAFLKKLGSILEAYSEKRVANATATGTVTMDLAVANNFDFTLTGPITFAFANVPASGNVVSVTAIVRQGATPQAITYPASVRWSNGTVGAIDVANKLGILTFVTVDGGTTWFTFLAGNKFTP